MRLELRLLLPSSKMNIGLININTIDDNKIISLQTITNHFHILNFNELNIKNVQKLNVIKSDPDYSWNIIPQLNYTDKNDQPQQHEQRIGFRIHNSISHLYSVEILDYKYFTQENRSAGQKDPCTVQTLFYSVQYKNRVLKNLIVYRTPDASPQNTLALYEYINECNAHFTLGDFNIDFKLKKNKNYILDHTSLTQIVKKPTRVQDSNRSTGTTTSTTIIDHVYIRKILASDVKYSVLDLVDPELPDYKITDHKLVKVIYKAPSPPVSLYIPRTPDPNRRYLPRGGIDWSSIPCNFDPNLYQLCSVDEYYHALVKYVTSVCDIFKIEQTKSLPPKKVFRFTMSKETQIAKNNFKSMSKYKSQCKKYLDYLYSVHAEATFKNGNNSSVMPAIIQARNNLYNANVEYKEYRNIRNKLVNRDQNNFFAKKFMSEPKNTKFLWDLTNRSKGKINKTVETLTSLQDIKYQPNSMLHFYYERSRIGLEGDHENNIFGDYDPIFDHQFEPPEGLECYEINIKIDDKMIDEAMNYKPSPHPDPDTLSMMIWHNLYTKNIGFKTAIRTLFYKALHQDLSIPGLELHDVRLFLKTDVVKRQKDLRPVADLTSLPKRMLRMTVSQIKKNKKEIFYSKTDFSQPGAGTQASVISCYEKCERGHFGLTGKPKVGTNAVAVTVNFYDSSNAYCTYRREYLVDNLQLAGTARQIFCRAMVRQNYFRVKTNLELSGVACTTTGGPQGQSGSGEGYSSIGKTITIDPCLDIEPTCFVGRQEFVDDRFDIVISSKKNHQQIIDRNLEKLIKKRNASGECLNEEKTVTFPIGCVPPRDERMLGMIANTSLNSHSEIGPTLDRLSQVICTVRACSTLTKSQRMQIARLQIHSAIFNFLFIVIYAAPNPLSEFRKRINISFKKAAQLPMTTPTVDIENYIYGMSFEDYRNVRIRRFCTKQIEFGNSIFDAIEYRGNAGTSRGARWQAKIGTPIGTLLKLHCFILNNYQQEFFTNLSRNKKNNVKNAFRNCIIFKPNYAPRIFQPRGTQQ